MCTQPDCCTGAAGVPVAGSSKVLAAEPSSGCSISPFAVPIATNGASAPRCCKSAPLAWSTDTVLFPGRYSFAALASKTTGLPPTTVICRFASVSSPSMVLVRCSCTAPLASRVAVVSLPPLPSTAYTVSSNPTTAAGLARLSNNGLLFLSSKDPAVAALVAQTRFLLLSTRASTPVPSVTCLLPPSLVSGCKAISGTSTPASTEPESLSMKTLLACCNTSKPCEVAVNPPSSVFDW